MLCVRHHSQPVSVHFMLAWQQAVQATKTGCTKLLLDHWGSQMFKSPHRCAGILVGPVISRYLTAMTASYVAMGGVALGLVYVAVMLPESLSPQSRLEVRAG